MSLTSQIRYVRVLDSTATDGSGKTGIAFGSFTAKYNVMGGTLTTLTTEDITTLGTYQAPTSAAHIRIKELNSADPTKGVYEVHFHNTQLANTGKKLWLFLSASGAACQPLEVDLLPYAEMDATAADNLKSAASNYSATRGLSGTALPAAAADAAGGLPISDAGGLDLDAKIGALTYGTANRVNAQVYGMEANVMTAAAAAADLTTELQSGLATAAGVSAVETDTQDIQSRLPAALTANGNMKSSLMEIIATALTETSGLLAAGFKKFFNVATPTGTVNSLPDAVPGAAGGVATTTSALADRDYLENTYFSTWDALWFAGSGTVDSASFAPTTTAFESSDLVFSSAWHEDALLVWGPGSANEGLARAILTTVQISPSRWRVTVDEAFPATPLDNDQFSIRIEHDHPITQIQSGLATQASVDTIDDFLDTEIAAIKAKTDQLTFTNANKVDSSLQAAADIATAVVQKIAHVVLRRTMTNVEAASDGDTLDLSSLYGAIQMLQEASVSGTTLTVKKVDGSTTLGTKTLTSDASADPITAIS